MTSLVGTRDLIRLVLRRDRFRVPMWLLVLTALLGAQVAGLYQAYPEAKDRIAYATVMSSSAAARLFGSPDGPSLGSITMVEIYATLGVLAGIMCAMGVVRHTRQNEQTGRLELVGATVVGRHAGLAAALAVYCSAMLVYAVSATLTLVALDLPVRGSALMALSIAGTGIVFAGVAAVSSQISSTARMANGIAGMLLGVAFLVRGVGAVSGSLADDKLGVVLAWPAWLSPLAWGDLTYPFTAQRWWVLVAYPLTFAALVGTAVALAARRDLGRGMIPTRAAQPEARRWLLSPLGLAVRLQRGLWVAWAFGAAVLGATTGLFTNAFEDLLADNDAARALFTAVGGSDALRDNAFALMMTWTAMMFVVYAVQAVLHLRSEEGGPLESVLATATGRVRWMASHLAVAAVGATLLLLVTGVTAGLSAALVAGDTSLFADLLAAAMVQLPAVLLVAAFCALAYGVSARLAAPVGWGAFALCLFTLIGDLFRVPDRVLDLSPFAHVPLMPAEPFSAGPLLWMLAAATASTCIAAVAFRHRDVGAP